MNRDCRLRIFLSNEAVIWALIKGRNKAYGLSRICHNIAALVEVGNVKLDIFYVKSEQNPADRPSRLI